MRVHASWALFAACVYSAAVHAQEPPKGPAEIIKRAAEARERANAPLQGTSAPAPADEAAPSAQGAPAPGPAPAPAAGGARDTAAPAAPAGQPPQAAPVPAGQPIAPSGAAQAQPAAPAPAQPAGQAQGGEPPPVGDDPHANMEGAPPLARRPMAKADPSTEVPVGSIRVRVLDVNERPVAGAELQLGTMSQDSARKAVPGRTGADGQYVFASLATGDKQAYRVNLLHQGAKYSSTPFRLPVDRGYDVVLRQLDTTRDARDLVLYVGATSLELKEERLRIVQQARLVNIGARTYVFPEDGLLVPLPKEAVAFQTEEVMTDQHLKEEPGKGVRISGSVPPGEITLMWGFDVPQTSTSAEFTFDLPWITFAYRVLADGAPGMTLDVDGFPPAELHSDGNRRFYVTEIVKRVGEPPLRQVRVRLSGIPGPGPMRFIAVGLALLVVGLGVVVARGQQPVKVQARPDALRTLERERARLLERARELEAERERGEIGPEFHRAALSDLEEQLSAVLYEQKRLAS